MYTSYYFYINNRTISIYMETEEMSLISICFFGALLKNPVTKFKNDGWTHIIDTNTVHLHS